MDERVRCWRRIKYCLFIAVRRGEIEEGRANRFMESFMNTFMGDTIEDEGSTIEDEERFFEAEFGFPLWAR